MALDNKQPKEEKKAITKQKRQKGSSGNSVTVEIDDDLHPNPVIRWTNRRRLAYMAFSAMCLVMGVLLFYTDIATITAIAPIVGTFFLVMGGIIGAYVGFTTLEGKWK